MKFGKFLIDECEEAYLAHSLMVGKKRLKKGIKLTPSLLELMRAADVTSATVAILEDGDSHEDEAAASIAEVAVGDNVVCSKAFTGRVNLIAEQDGIVEVDEGAIDAINSIDESLTIATLSNHAMVHKGQMVATAKTIPFAAPAKAMAVLHTLKIEPAVKVRPYMGMQCSLLQTELPSVKESLYSKTKEVVAQRLSDFGATLLDEGRCAHDEGALADLLLDPTAGDLVLIMGASAITDRRDVIPAAIEKAGGHIIHFGMPVDPGNLLLVARLGHKWVLGLPGCARSLKLNGIDHVLSRLCAGMNIRKTDIMGMGVGGLLNEYVGRPQPRAGRNTPHNAQPSVAIAILAAGRSSRMGESNKLLLPYKDKTVLDHVITEVHGAGNKDVFVVSGHDRSAVEGIAKSHDVKTTHNSNYLSGMSGSVQAALGAVPEHCDAVLMVLGDMPGITRDVISQLIAAYNPVEGRNLIMPVHNGKRGNPVLWGREFFADFAKLSGDKGAKVLLRNFEEDIVEVEVGSDGIFIDIDTAEAYQAFLKGDE